MIRYALAWLGVGAFAATVILALLSIKGDGTPDVALPPLKQTELARAARAADCELRRVRPGERVDPPGDAPSAGGSVRPGIYERAPRADALAAALRRGIVVIQYRPQLGEDEREELQIVQRAVPSGTIVTPNGTSMPYDLAATAHRRLLGCERYSAAALDAIRLFRGRYLGLGPGAAK